MLAYDGKVLTQQRQLCPVSAEEGLRHYKQAEHSHCAKGLKAYLTGLKLDRALQTLNFDL